jgi:hypothetical protein
VCPVEQRDTDGEPGLEHEQLGGDGTGLPEEDPGGVEARQPEAVPSGVGRLDGIAALHGQERRQQDRDPEEPCRCRRQDPAVGAQRQAEEEQDRDRERTDLIEANPGTDLDAEILSGDEHGVTQHERDPL